MKRNTLQLITVGTLMCAVFFVATPNVLKAQTTVDNYQPDSLQEMIAYLYGVIAQLQAQLDAQTGGSNTGSVGNSGSYGSSDDVRIATGGVSSLSGRSVEFSGTITFKDRATVQAWFEYGTTRSLVNSTPILQVNGRAGTTDRVDADISGLQANRTYYYRFVVEDSNGDIVEGAIHSFTTAYAGSDDWDDDYYDDDDYYNDDDDYYGFSLSTDRRTYERRDTIEVEFRQSSRDLHSRNYVGLYRVGACDTCYTTWKYTGDKTSGDMTFRAPAAGDYELRLYIRDGDRFDRVATSHTIEIE